MTYRSYIAIPSNSWVDDFIDWLNPGSRCCRLYTTLLNLGKFCPAHEREHLSKKKKKNTKQFKSTHTTHNRLSLFFFFFCHNSCKKVFIEVYDAHFGRCCQAWCERIRPLLSDLFGQPARLAVPQRVRIALCSFTSHTEIKKSSMRMLIISLWQRSGGVWQSCGTRWDRRNYRYVISRWESYG